MGEERNIGLFLSLFLPVWLSLSKSLHSSTTRGSADGPSVLLGFRNSISSRVPLVLGVVMAACYCLPGYASLSFFHSLSIALKKFLN